MAAGRSRRSHAQHRIVSAFEERLERNVALAFFIPAVVYIADAVGTQTEALVIRALAVDVPVRRLVRREAITGRLSGPVATIAQDLVTIVLYFVIATALIA